MTTLDQAITALKAESKRLTNELKAVRAAIGAFARRVRDSTNEIGKIERVNLDLFRFIGLDTSVIMRM